MKKIKAPTLEAAYEQAAKELGCSVTDLKYEVIQHPSSGILGLFKKEAIIVAACKYPQRAPQTQPPVTSEKKYPAKESKEKSVQSIPEKRIEEKQLSVEHNEIVESFFGSEYHAEEEVYEIEEEIVVYDELARLIEAQLKHLIDVLISMW